MTEEPISVYLHIHLERIGKRVAFFLYRKHLWYSDNSRFNFPFSKVPAPVISFSFSNNLSKHIVLRHFPKSGCSIFSHRIEFSLYTERMTSCDCGKLLEPLYSFTFRRHLKDIVLKSSSKLYAYVGLHKYFLINEIQKLMIVKLL